MLADRPEGVDQGMPVYLWAGVGAVVLLLVVLTAGYWGLFGGPRWVRLLARWLYRPKRRHRWYRRNQLRPVRPVARVDLEDDAVQLLPVGAPLALEASPADVIEGPKKPLPWWAKREFQHREGASL